MSKNVNYRQQLVDLVNGMPKDNREEALNLITELGNKKKERNGKTVSYGWADIAKEFKEHYRIGRQRRVSDKGACIRDMLNLYEAAEQYGE